METNTVAPICPACGQPAKLSAGKFGTKAECCGLWSWGGKALVSRETHANRIRAHEAFDAIWKSGKIARGEAYAKLAALMGMTRSECHMSLMTAGDAAKVIRLVAQGKITADPPPPLMRTTRSHSSKRRKSSRRREIFITIGADCPWNSTPGIRQVHIFPSADDARDAGFVPWENASVIR